MTPTARCTWRRGLPYTKCLIDATSTFHGCPKQNNPVEPGGYKSINRQSTEIKINLTRQNYLSNPVSTIRDDPFCEWQKIHSLCADRESNPGQMLGRHLCYHYTIGAWESAGPLKLHNQNYVKFRETMRKLAIFFALWKVVFFLFRSVPFSFPHKYQLLLIHLAHLTSDLSQQRNLKTRRYYFYLGLKK